ncbi:MAG: 2-hydroxyacid dehydrogenase [Chloroflexota bacterium]
MSKPKVYVGRKLHDAAFSRIAEVTDAKMWPQEGRCSEEVLLQEIGDIEAFVGNSRWTAAVMDAAPKLRIIANVSVGFDNTDVPAATERGIIVTNTPGVLSDTTADTAFALMIATARRIVEADRYVRTGNWKQIGGPASFFGLDVHHATLGIIGMGRIGAEMAHRAMGFHMNVIYSDAFRREDLEHQYGYRYVDLETLLRESDFISLHVNLTPETKNMLSREQFAKMKRTAIVVNASRGGVIDEPALVAALREGQIAGAGLDVFAKEPINVDNPLLTMDNVVVLPHIGSATIATREKMAELAIDNAIAVVQGRPPITPVNPEVLPRARK